MTAEDVLGDLAGLDLEVLRAERVARRVPAVDEQSRTHEELGHADRVAWDCLVRVVRR